MKIGYLIIGLLISTFLITACSIEPTGYATKEIEAKTPPQPMQEPTEEKPSCIDKCSINSCDGYKFISCETKDNGCKSEVNKGYVKGKCGVKCVQDSDCGSNQNCESYKCKCSDTCSTDSCSGFEFISCESKLDGCKAPINKGLIRGKCNVDCVSNSDCNLNYECLTYKCVKKVSEEVESQTSTISDSLKQLQEKLKEQQRINSKIEDCTKLCAGEDYNIPYIKNTFWSTCYQVYYYTGEEALDEMITDCQNA